MPGKTKKVIYVGKSLSELNKRVEQNVVKGNARRLGNSAGKIMSAADLAYKDLDEERAYILYMRYALMWKLVKNSADYKKDQKFYNDMLGTKDIQRAIKHAEELSNSLATRYQDLDEEAELKAKLAKEDEEVNAEMDNVLENGEPEIPEEKTLGSDGLLRAAELYELIGSEETSALVMDVRTTEQYSSSRMTKITSMNVPREIIKAGSTAMSIQKELPSTSQSDWNRRGDFDYVILVDWDSIDLAQGSVLASLKDALCKWDSKKTLKHDALILQGGYTDWIMRYPMYTTDPKVAKPPSYESLMKPSGSLNFDYPEFDDKPPEPPVTNENHSSPQTSPSSQVPSRSIPAVNRTIKPQISNVRSTLSNGYPATTNDPTKVTTKERSDGGGATAPSKTMDQQPVEPQSPTVDKQIDGSQSVERKVPTVDRSSKPPISDLKGNVKDRNETKDDSEEKTKMEEDLKEKEEMERQEREELEALRRKEEEVKVQLEKMRMEKTKLENSDLKRENQALEDSIQKHQAEMARLKIDMEAHKARLKKPQTAEEKDKITNGGSPVKTVNGSKSKVSQSTSGPAKPASEANKAAVNEEKQSANHLPAGWEMKYDEKSKRYFYVDHETQTSHWTLPASAMGPAKKATGESKSETAVGKEQTKPDSLNIAKSPSDGSCERTPQGTKKVPLKSQTMDSPSQPTLKRSFSSPNIAKMVADEEQSRKMPTIDRSKKPANRPTAAQMHHQHQLTVRKRNLDPVYGSQARGLAGLRNLGNTCFMNSVVQCLSNTTLLTKYFLDDAYLSDINQNNPLGRKGEVAVEFAVVVKALWAGQYKSIAPRDLMRTVNKFVPEFNRKIGHHHDSQEFLVFLMDGLHEDLNQVRKRQYVKEEDYSNLSPSEGAHKSWMNHLILNKSIIVNLFQGQFRSVVKCWSCKNESVKYEAFMFLELPIPSRIRCSLQDCLKRFSSEEKLEGDNATFCTKCKRLRDSVKTIQIWKLPLFLIIHLKRFYFEGMWRQKLKTNVDYPVTSLDMSKFTQGANQRELYNLYAVSNHTGTLDGGHYTAYCKSVVNRRWYKYDDTDVFECSSGVVQSTAAYILFYTSVSLTEP